MKKILMIEDDFDMTLIVKKTLESSGFEVAVAYDSLQGTRAAHELKPDLILLDLNMPAGGGITTLQNLKLSIHTVSIPIIVLTGTDDESLKQKALEMGIDALMSKPYERDDLIKKVKEITGETDG